MKNNESFKYIGWLWYRFSRKVINRYRDFTVYILKVRYRFFRKVLFHYKEISLAFVIARFRLVRRLRFRFFRIAIFFIWRMWVGKVYGFDKIPMHEPAIIISNHLSYFDFWILSAILKKNTVFVAVKGLDQRGLVGWTMRLNTIVYIDRDKPGHAFFKNLIWQVRGQQRSVVIYPEGTRSRTGKMLAPKSGFVKLALKLGVPIIPIAMRGTYEILPPHKQMPKLKRCDVYVLDKIYLTPFNPDFYDLFFRKSGTGRKYSNLDDDELQEVAFRIMDKVRIAAWQDWDESVVRRRLDVPEEVSHKRKVLLKEKEEA